jgi:hypothetical protein
MAKGAATARERGEAPMSEKKKMNRKIEKY